MHQETFLLLWIKSKNICNDCSKKESNYLLTLTIETYISKQIIGIGTYCTNCSLKIFNNKKNNLKQDIYIIEEQDYFDPIYNYLLNKLKD